MQATATTLDHEQEYTPINSRNKVLVASLIGTAIEFFDFTFTPLRPLLCFRISSSRRAIQRQQRYSRSPPSPSPSSRAPLALPFLVILAIALGVKRRWSPLLLTMGISTVVIGLLPGYATIGIFAPLLLALARFGQGLGLGGEWGGAALLATENAPPRKRALYGSFPQLGAPIGFFFANGTFLLLSWLLTDEQFMSWGWRAPFIFSAVLVIIGLYVRVSLHESPVFEKVAKAKNR